MKLFCASCMCLLLATLALAQNPVPFVNQPPVPDAVVPGGAQFTLTVNGTGFVSGATVNWNGRALVTTFVNQSQLAATVPAVNIAAAGTGAVTVINPTPGGGASNVQYVGVANRSVGIAFAPAVTYNSGGQIPSGLVVADVNGDGKPDLLVVNQAGAGNGDGLVAVLLGNGDGTFQPAATYDSGGTFGGSYYCTDFDPCASISALAVADVNGDGKLDLVVANECCAANGDGLVGVLLGNGDGTFQPVVTYDSGGFIATSVAAADVNGDGKLDLLAANICADQACPDTSTDGSVGVLLGNGDGTFQPAVAYDAGNGTTAVVVTTDMNGDGKLDLVVVDACAINPPALCEGGAGVGVLLGNGNGTFQPVVLSGTVGNAAYSGVVADVNGDGKLDVLVANVASSDLIDGDATAAVLLGNGDGSLQSAVPYDLGEQKGRSITVGDVNGDGVPDLMMTLDCDPNNFVCETGWASLLLGNGDGTFQSPVSFYSGGTSVQSVALADVNGDGKPDVVVSVCVDYCAQGAVAVLINTGKAATTTTLVSSLNPSGFGQAVTFTATAMPQGVGTPTGTVSFNDGTTNLGKSDLNGSSVATLTTSTLATGTLAITATYNGDSHFSPSTSAVLQQVVQGGIAVFSPTALTFDYPTVGVTSAPQNIALMNTGDIALTITSIGITGTDSGDFSQTNACGSSLPAGGSCNIAVTITPKAAGTRRAAISVVDSAQQSPQMAALAGTTSDFSITSSLPTTQTITPGQAANYSVTISPVNGFDRTVSLSCSGAPANSTCILTPRSLTGSGTADVAVVTTGPSAALMEPWLGGPTSKGLAGGLFLFCVLGPGLFCGFRISQSWGPRLRYTLALFCLLSIGGIVSCGGGSGGASGETATGTYTLTVTGTFTSGGVRMAHNTNFTLVVK